MERVKSISIPDQLWSNRHMPSGAKLLWGLLRAFNHRRYFTFAEVRELAGLCQNTLIKYLAILTSHGCLHYEPLGASFRCRAVWKGGAAALLLPVDLILDLRISPSAKLVWGVFNGSKEPLSYVDLQRMTGYSHKSLAKYIKELRTERVGPGFRHAFNQAKAVPLRSRKPHRSRA